jgi:hypothetical protein
MPLTVLMDLAELEDGCSWLLCAVALSLSVVTLLFLVLNLGTAVVEGRPWQELLIAIIRLLERAPLAGFGKDKCGWGEVVDKLFPRTSLLHSRFGTLVPA